MLLPATGRSPALRRERNSRAGRAFRQRFEAQDHLAFHDEVRGFEHGHPEETTKERRGFGPTRSDHKTCSAAVNRDENECPRPAVTRLTAQDSAPIGWSGQ